MTGHTAHTGHTIALDTERESQVTHSDLDHGVRVHMMCGYYSWHVLRSGGVIGMKRIQSVHW